MFFGRPRGQSSSAPLATLRPAGLSRHYFMAASSTPVSQTCGRYSICLIGCLESVALSATLVVGAAPQRLTTKYEALLSAGMLIGAIVSPGAVGTLSETGKWQRAVLLRRGSPAGRNSRERQPGIQGRRTTLRLTASDHMGRYSACGQTQRTDDGTLLVPERPGTLGQNYLPVDQHIAPQLTTTARPDYAH